MNERTRTRGGRESGVVAAKRRNLGGKAGREMVVIGILPAYWIAD